MINISFLYPNSADKFFDVEYYVNTHIPMSMKLQGDKLKGTQVDIGISGVLEGNRPSYLAICHFRYESLESFLSAVLPHQKELTDDMKNYTDIEPIFQVSEIAIVNSE